MLKIVVPFQFNKTLTVPASKSHLQRLIALSSICNQTSFIHNVHFCDDVNTALSVAQQIGASIKVNAKTLEITGISKFPQNKSLIIDINESGLSARMFGIIASALFDEVVLTGKGSILKRNMSSLIDILSQAGCEVHSQNNYLPIYVKGKANYSNIQIKETDTSQIITGLLFAAPLSSKDVTIFVNHPISIPYIELSINTAKLFGIQIEYSKDYDYFHIKAPQQLQPINTTAEGDWSNAAFFIVAAVLSGKGKFLELNFESSQADKFILKILEQCNARFYIENKNELIVEKSNELKPFNVNLTHCPDLFPPLVVLAAGINGTSTLSGISRLINKESNRLNVLINEFSRLGLKISTGKDTMIIKGNGKLSGGIFHSHNDHRIAMAGAIAATISENPVVIENPEAISKSYPLFFEDLLD